MSPSNSASRNAPPPSTAANEALRREIAERQRLEREARRAEHFALLGRLAAGVSHEIRNPLSDIVLHVDLMEEDLRSPSPESHEEMAQALIEIKTNLARIDSCRITSLWRGWRR